MAFCEVRQLRSGWSLGQVGSVWSRLFTSCQPYLRGQNGGAITWPVVFSDLQLNLSPSFPGVRISEGETTTIFAVNNAAWLKGNRFVLKTVPIWFARIVCLRRKAAAAVKAATKVSERDAMEDSVEIHAPDDTLQFPSKRSSSDGSSKAKWTKTKKPRVSGSSEPKSMVSTVERPSPHGADRRSVEECGP